MLETMQSFISSHILDACIYIAMLVVLLVGFGKCFAPLLRNASALHRASRVMKEEHKRKVARPSWNDLRFLGKGLQNEWAAFLQNAELMDLYNDSCDVEEYINTDTAIYNATNTPLAEMLPGIFVSLGILGTFLGISTGLSGLTSLAESEQVYSAILTLIGGMQTAFLTSIVGIVASILFNFTNRMCIGRAEYALSRFINIFTQYGMPKPPATENKLLAIEQQQNDYLRTFVEDISVRTAAQMEQAILRAMLPVQQSMDQFMNAATKQQVEGVDRIVRRFQDRMDESMGGEFTRLGETLRRLTDEQQRTQEELRESHAAVAAMTRDVTQVHQLSQEVLGQFEQFVSDITSARKQNEEDGQRTQELLEKMHAASQQQARYLTKLQEYQASLQGAMQQYATWTDQFMAGAQQQTQATSEAIGRAAGQMENSATLLDQSYHTFVAQIQEGLARALALMDETLSRTSKEMSASLNQMQKVVAGVPDMLSTSSRRYSGQVEQFVDALSQMQRSMAALTEALPPHKEG